MIERLDEIIGQEECPWFFRHQALERAVSVHLIAVRSTDPLDTFSFKHAVQMTACAAVTVNNDHPLIVLTRLANAAEYSIGGAVRLVVQQDQDAIGVGEGPDDLKNFDAKNFAENLVGISE